MDLLALAWAVIRLLASLYGLYALYYVIFRSEHAWPFGRHRWYQPACPRCVIAQAERELS